MLATGALTTLVLVGAAVPASAATTFAPTAGCYFVNTDGTITAVFGYTNTGGSATVAHGWDNYVITGHEVWDAGMPAQTQPTQFRSGTYASVWTVTAPANGFASWSLNGTTATVSAHDNSAYGVTASPICRQGTSLPATNGVVTTVLGFALLLPIGGWALSRRRTVLDRSH